MTFFGHVADPELARLAGDCKASERVEDEDYGGYRSRVTLTAVADRPYLRVDETVLLSELGKDAHGGYDGIGFKRTKAVSLILRDQLTRSQRWRVYFPGPGGDESDLSKESMTPRFFGHSEGGNAVAYARMKRSSKAGAA